jgi:AraC family transcriptional regulator of adaptative response/methylated-DNA-[protein]-cysteine methyltransferase
VTPRQFQDSCRVCELKTQLRTRRVTDAIYEAGYGSSSRVYERAATHLGMTPASYGAGGRGAEITYATVPSALGRLMIAATDHGLCFVEFGSSEKELERRLAQEYPEARRTAMIAPPPGEFRRWMEGLLAHLSGREPAVALPVDVRMTAFQRQVWEYLRRIPRGATQSYAAVAEGIGRPGAARAVARACASNRVAVAIPCHRVIRGDGALGGYRWGAKRKKALLEAEL